MKVALTGATGFIGSHVLTELQGHGHEVLAVVRDEAQADIVTGRGAKPTVVDLYDRPAVVTLLNEADGAIHTASPGDETSANLDSAVVDAAIEGFAGTNNSDTRFVVYMEGQGSEPTQALHGRDALTPVFDDLNRYQATMHLNGQSTISLDGDRATGETYCIAHHLFTEAGERKLMIAWLRYGDTFVKLDGAWLFAERNLHVDWIETRPSHP